MITRDKLYRRTASVLFLLLSCTLGAATFQQAGVGTVGYWKFDETSGPTAADSSGNGNGLNWGGTPVPSTTIFAPVNGNSRSLGFDGTSADVATVGNLTNFPTGNTPHTTAGWVYMNATPANRAWILLLGNAANGAEHWLVDKTGTTQLGVYGGGLGSGQFQPNLTPTTWHHIALAFDGTNLSGYLDGVSLGIQPATYNFAGVPLTVAQAHNGENFFNGYVDDLRLYDRALDPTEIAALYAGSTGPAAPTNLSAIPGNFSVTLNWTASTGPGVVSYTVGRSLVAGGSPPGKYTILSSGVSSPSYIDSTATNGTPYYYVVYADSFGESPPSNEATATPGAGTTLARGKGGIGCGATGLEILLPLGLLGLLRRRLR